MSAYPFPIVVLNRWGHNIEELRTIAEWANDTHIGIVEADPKWQEIRRRVQDKRENRRGPCAHLGQQIGEVECPTCSGKTMLKVFACEIFKQCTRGTSVEGIACCAKCSRFEPPNNPACRLNPSSPADSSPAISTKTGSTTRSTSTP
jgi:hypothetical protein